MKKFRLFTLLAIIATISTSFAAWTYVNYKPSYTDVSDSKITLTVDGGNVTATEALGIEITDTTMPGVTFTQNADNLRKIDATVSGDVNVKVTAASDADIAKYSYYYTVYSSDSLSALNNIKTLSEYETSTDIPDPAKVKSLSVAADGTATIPADELSEFFVTSATLSSDPEAFSASLAEFKHIISNNNSTGIYLKVYAVKN